LDPCAIRYRVSVRPTSLTLSWYLSPFPFPDFAACFYFFFPLLSGFGFFDPFGWDFNPFFTYIFPILLWFDVLTV